MTVSRAHTLALTVQERIDLFVIAGFRDEVGVWHEGPHHTAATDALLELELLAETVIKERDALLARIRAEARSNACIYCGKVCAANLRVCPRCVELPKLDPSSPSYAGTRRRTT